MSYLERCPNCGLEYNINKGHQCADAVELLGASANAPEMSDPDAMLDELVSRGSVPNLASLYKKGKESGLIKPGVEYGST